MVLVNLRPYSIAVHNTKPFANMIVVVGAGCDPRDGGGRLRSVQASFPAALPELTARSGAGASAASGALPA